MVIYSGRAGVNLDGHAVAALLPGQFIGSISFITDEIAPADIVAEEGTCYIAWPKMRLKSYLAKSPQLHAAIQVTLARDLTDRVRAAWERIRGGEENQSAPRHST